MKIIRDVIHIKPVKYSAESDVGYVHITSFNEETTADLQKAVMDLKKEIGPKLTGLHCRPPQQSRRPARPGNLSFRCVSRPGRHRAHQGP